MKNLIDNFKEFLAEAQKSDYINDGMIDLYHYANLGYVGHPETLEVDPSRFGEASHSRNEMARSSFPRSFFYVDPAQRERFVAGGRPLYTYQVPELKIYDFRKDPLGYDRVPSEEFPNGLIDPDTPTKSLYMGDGKHSWGELFEKVSEDYDGMFYSLRSFDVVVLFKPVTATLVDKEERERLESGE